MLLPLLLNLGFAGGEEETVPPPDPYIPSRVQTSDSFRSRVQTQDTYHARTPASSTYLGRAQEPL